MYLFEGEILHRDGLSSFVFLDVPPEELLRGSRLVEVTSRVPTCRQASSRRSNRPTMRCASTGRVRFGEVVSAIRGALGSEDISGSTSSSA